MKHYKLYVKITFRFLLLLSTSLTFSQNYGDFPAIPKQKLLDDVEILYQGLDKFHSGMYWYTPKDSVDAAFAEVRKKIDKDLNVLEFVIGDKFTAGGTVSISVGNVDGSGETKILTDLQKVGDNGKFVHEFNSKDLAPGIYEIIVTDNETGKSASSFLVVRDADAATNVKVDVTPKRVVKGEETPADRLGIHSGRNR